MSPPAAPGRTRVAVLLALAGLALLLPLLAVLLLFVMANGLTLSAVTLASLPALVALLCLALPRAHGRARRRILGAALALTALDAGYVAARLARPAATAPAVQYCEDGDCSRSPPLLARVPDEGEAALAGLTMSAALGLIGGEERASLEALLRRDYAALAGSPRYAGLPVAPMIHADGHIRTLQWVPPGRERAPCIVFLHGFGGQLTVYLRSLVESGLGDDFVLIAPFFEASGRWWTAEGEAIVRELVTEHLPSAADPERVFLMGLSNGAVGVARLVTRPGLSGRFRGGILLSGSAGPGAGELGGVDLLFISGQDDPRFPIEGVRSDAAAHRARGAEVAMEALPGDHFLVLSSGPALAERVRAWMKPRLGSP